MSSYVIELLDGSHEWAGFVSGIDSVDCYLRQTARGHMEKGVSVTRVLIEAEAMTPKAVLGYYARYGFLRVVPAGLRMFLPRVSLEAGAEIQLGSMASMGQVGPSSSSR